MNLEQICFTIKIGAAVLVIAGCTGVGFYQSGLVSQRIREDREFYRIMTLLYGEIEYAATPLPQGTEKKLPHAAVRHLNCFLKLWRDSWKMPEKKHCGRFGWLRYSTVLPTAPWAPPNGKFCSTLEKIWVMAIKRCS